MASRSRPNCSVLDKHACGIMRAPAAHRDKCLLSLHESIRAAQQRNLPAALRTRVCASVPFLPESSSESFCTVFWQAISESMDDSIAQFIRQPDGTSVATDRLVAALVTFGNGSAQRICATPKVKAERGTVATSRNKAMLQRLPERADECSAAD